MNGKSKIGAFILASCLIDYLACFHFNKKATGDTYKDFCKIYLKKYNADNLYHSFRCKLVHNYSSGGSYALTDNKEYFHMKEGTGGKLILNLESFINDVETAMNKYFSEIDKNEELKNNLIERYRKEGIFGIVRVDVKK